MDNAILTNKEITHICHKCSINLLQINSYDDTIIVDFFGKNVILEKFGDIYNCKNCKTAFYTDRWNILHEGYYIKKNEKLK